MNFRSRHYLSTRSRRLTDCSTATDLSEDGDEDASSDNASSQPGCLIVLLTEKQGCRDEADGSRNISNLTEQHRPTLLLQPEKHRKGHAGNQHLISAVTGFSPKKGYRESRALRLLNLPLPLGRGPGCGIRARRFALSSPEVARIAVSVS